MLRYTYTSGSLYCCTSGHVTLSKITLSHHGVGVDIITVSTPILSSALVAIWTLYPTDLSSVMSVALARCLN